MATKHSDVPRNYWKREIEPLGFGREKFRLTVKRKGQDISLDGLTEAFDWSDDGKHVMSGSISLRKPAYDPDGKFSLGFGDLVVCEAARTGFNNWREVWRMRVDQPEFQIANSVFQWALVDDLVRLAESKGDFKYRKSKAKPHGWKGHEIIADLAKRYGFKVGRLPKFRHPIKALTMENASPLDVIGRVLRYERVARGSRYFVRWEKGALAIVPYQRSAELLSMSGTIIDGILSQTKEAGFATSVIVTGSRRSIAGKDSRKRSYHKKVPMKVTVDADRAIQKFGRVTKKVKAPDSADSYTDLRRFGKHYLAKHAVPTQQLSFSHEGIHSLRRGAALRVTIRDAGLNGRIVFVKEVRHNVGQGNDYTMEVTVQFDDPFAKDKERRKQALCDAARRNHRKPPAGCPAERKKTAPKDHNAAKRS